MATTSHTFRVEVHEDADKDHSTNAAPVRASHLDENATRLKQQAHMKMPQHATKGTGAHIIGKKYEGQTKSMSSSSTTMPSMTSLPAAKRALGDITNAVLRNQGAGSTNHTSSSMLAVGQSRHQLKGNKIRRTGSTKPPSLAARRSKSTAVNQATSKPEPQQGEDDGSPMATSATQPRNYRGGLDRLAKRAHAAAASQAGTESSFRFGQPSDKAGASSSDIVDSEDSTLKAQDDMPLYEKLLSNVTNEDDYAEADEYTPCGQTKIPETVVNIDVDDLKHCCMESAYASAIHKRFVEVEERFMVDPNYLCNQQDITSKMRSILIDWLVDVHLKFKLRCETLFLTVNIIDRYLAIRQTTRRKLQLVGVTAMLIASKYEDIYAPEIKQLVYISDKAYTTKEIIDMEASILNVLNFDITLPYSLTFMYRYYKAFNQSCALPDSTPQGSKESLANLHVYLAKYLIELSLLSCKLLQYRPSEVAGAAVMLAGKYVYHGAQQGSNVEWNDTLRFYSGNNYTEEDLSPCMHDLEFLLDHEIDPQNSNKLTAVKRKFSSSRYCQISNRIASIIHTIMQTQQQQHNNPSANGMDICGSE